MKKLKALCAAIVLALAGSVAFAEYNATYSYTLGGGSFKLKDDSYSAKFGYGFSPFGIAINSTWFAGDATSSAFNIGFDLKFGVWLSGGYTIESVKADDWFNMGEYLSIGPAFRYCINAENIVRITPGLQLNIDESWYTGGGNGSAKMYDLAVAFSLDLAYQHFFTDKIGLNLGFDMDIPFAGIWWQEYRVSGYSSSIDASVGTGFLYRFLIGVTIR